MQQIYSRKTMPKCDFNKVTKQTSPVNLLNIFRKPFPKNISGGLLLFSVNYAYSDKIETIS